MADKVDGKLCDYGSSMDESEDEARRMSDAQEATSSGSSPGSSGVRSDGKASSPKMLFNTPRQHCDDSSKRSKHGRTSRRTRRSRSRSHSRSRDRSGRSHRRRDHSRERRRDRDNCSHRRRRSYSREGIRRRRQGRRRRSSSSSSSSDVRRSRHSPRHGRDRETAFSRKIIGSRSELAKVQEAVRPVDPIAAKLEAVNKASAIMASAVKPTSVFRLHPTCIGFTGESTPQEVLARIQATQMTQVRAKAEAAAAAANLPSFYNPMSVNAAKLAEQQQKRKLLWSRKSDPVAEAKEEAKSTMWKKTSMVAGKGDSAAAAKFRKLMGIHEDSSNNAAGAPSDEALNQAREQADLFRNLEHEFETSRTLTHTQRGVGLGYSSAMTDYRAYAAMKQAGGSAQQEGK
ncbi:unnamed protein product [Hydatigera taeniaeformis]|uniref:SMAP domain-containing protein n=1 Tax=Hydatigena taeniaeformis TaxID=6205 RepID=A0A0R3X4W2_HYDTA|nr:unnamed protein product [Hydatigera taeniaeformis]